MISRLIILAFLICNYTVTNSQTEVKNLDIKIMSSHFDMEISSAYQPKFERKVIGILTQNGVVNTKGSTFAIYPSLSVTEFDKMEGIKTLQTAQLELSLMVNNVFSNETLIVFSKNITGSGKTKNAAINNAISSIRPNQKAYLHFVNEKKKKIDSYYNSECETILADAKDAISNNENEKAVAILNTLPKSSDCRNMNVDLLNQAFQNYQKQNCNQLIQKANIASLKKDYKNAIDLLGLVDIESSCANDAKIALQKIATANDDQTAKKLAFLNKVYSDNKEIQKARQQSMNAISNTYIEGISKK
ncbi:MAG: hypothetical protein AB8F94_18300 [Saprospiraceae bacterium]